MDADFLIQNEGTIYLFRPLSDAAIEWADNNLGDDTQWFHDSFVCEHRYARDLAVTLTEEGFKLQ